MFCVALSFLNEYVCIVKVSVDAIDGLIDSGREGKRFVSKGSI